MTLIEDTVEIQSSAEDVAEIETIEYDGDFQIIEAHSDLLEGLENE